MNKTTFLCVQHPTPRFLTPAVSCGLYWRTLTSVLLQAHSPGITSRRAEVIQCSFRAVRDGRLQRDHFTAMPGSAAWLPPGACWSWWRRTGQRERCWWACSRSRLWARQTASRGRPGSGRCPGRKPQPAQENLLLALCRFSFKNTK